LNPLFAELTITRFKSMSDEGELRDSDEEQTIRPATSVHQMNIYEFKRDRSSSERCEKKSRKRSGKTDRHFTKERVSHHRRSEANAGNSEGKRKSRIDSSPRRSSPADKNITRGHGTDRRGSSRKRESQGRLIRERESRDRKLNSEGRHSRHDSKEMYYHHTVSASSHRSRKETYKAILMGKFLLMVNEYEWVVFCIPVINFSKQNVKKSERRSSRHRSRSRRTSSTSTNRRILSVEEKIENVELPVKKDSNQQKESVPSKIKRYSSVNIQAEVQLTPETSPIILGVDHESIGESLNEEKMLLQVLPTSSADQHTGSRSISAREALSESGEEAEADVARSQSSSSFGIFFELELYNIVLGKRSHSFSSSKSADAENENNIFDESKTADVAASSKNDDSPSDSIQKLPVYYPSIMGCRSVEEYHCLNRIEEGTYGVVYRAMEKRTGEIVALKRLKMEKEREGFPITSLREVNMLMKVGKHPNVVNVLEVVVGSSMDKIYLVMEYVEHDMKSLMETMKQPFLVGEVKTLTRQLLNGLYHLHDNWILHRDLKTSNLLLNHMGILKIGDFGLSREYGSPLRSYTPVVVTLWYRAPELLLGIKEYSTSIDVWSVGCIFGEFLTLKPLFAGKSEIEQMNKIFKMLGTPNETIWPGYSSLPGVKRMTFAEYPFSSLRKHFGATLSDKGFDLMNKLLTYDPKARISAFDAMAHEWFHEEPRPIHPSQFPTWPAKSQNRIRHNVCPRPPSGGKTFKDVNDDTNKELLEKLKIAPNQSRAAGFNLKFDMPKFRLWSITQMDPHHHHHHHHHHHQQQQQQQHQRCGGDWLKLPARRLTTWWRRKLTD
ncbi:Cyclin-dependent kinase 11B, partial [Trichinella britovi]